MFQRFQQSNTKSELRVLQYIRATDVECPDNSAIYILPTLNFSISV
jgi:hypothetical protein